MDETRSALIVASYEYADPGLRRLRAPASDARALEAVLRDPGIGRFEVHTLLNEPAHHVNLAVEEFFADRRPDDLLLIHFSSHGVKDENGELYFAMTDTLLRRLGATAVAAEFVNRRMGRSRSRRIVLLLDCCYAGAFERGMTARAGAGMGIEAQFGGRGRAVITASSAMEYAFEGDELADSREQTPSVFTSALVEGLATGDADRDQDGQVALDELYDYIYDKVRAATPNQTPGKWVFGVQGELFIARRARPVATPAPLPPKLQEAIDNPFAAVRAAAVQELEHLLQGKHAGLALAARVTLERLTGDDSRMVAAAATSALSAEPQSADPGPVPPQLELSATSIDFGRLPLDSESPERRVRLGNAGGGILNARAATQASWLRLRHVGDELVIAIDTSAAGKHEDVVSIDSDGGPATVRVLATVEPAPPAQTKPPKLELSTLALDFGRIRIGSRPSSRRVRVLSNGNLNVRIASSPEWIQVQSTPYMLTLRPAPTAQGSLLGEVVVDSDAGSATIRVTAMAVAATEPPDGAAPETSQYPPGSPRSASFLSYLLPTAAFVTIFARDRVILMNAVQALGIYVIYAIAGTSTFFVHPPHAGMPPPVSSQPWLGLLITVTACCYCLATGLLIFCVIQLARRKQPKIFVLTKIASYIADRRLSRS